MLCRCLSITVLLAGSLLSEVPVRPAGSDLGLVSAAPTIEVFDAVRASDATLEGRLRNGLPIPDQHEIAAGMTSEGTRVYVLKLRLSGAQAVRVHFERFALRPAEHVFVYGLDSGSRAGAFQGPFDGAGPSLMGGFWTLPVSGDTAIVEYQTSEDRVGLLPFAVVELVEAAPVEHNPTPVSTAASGGRRVSFLRGVPIEHEVVDGIAVVEGDILVARTDELVEAPEGTWGERFVRSIATKYASRYWPNGVMPYQIAPDVTISPNILAAIDHWNQKLAGSVSIVPRTNEQSYVLFSNPSSDGTCASYIGMQGTAAQTIWAGGYCSTGNMIHEIGHSLGLYHEHVRADRDSFVTILWQNITPGKENNFQQDTANSIDLGNYDYGSIMHYPASGFSSNGLPTIETIPPGVPIGQRTALSTVDVQGIQAIYGSSTPPSQVLVTMASNPAGQTISVDGGNTVAPKDYMWSPGSAHTVSAMDTDSGGTKRAFQSWSDGGARTHTYTTPSATAVLSANYAVSHRVTSSSSNTALGSVTQSPGPSGTYVADGSQATFTATPAASACFTGWSGALSGSTSPLTALVNQPLNLVANFSDGAVSVAPTAIQVSYLGGTISVSISTGAGCQWTVSAPDKWIKPAASSGSGAAAVDFAISRNTGKKSRTGVITIGGIDVVVTQANR